jgi:hypothetical protein
MRPIKTMSSRAPVRIEEEPKLAIYVAYTSEGETVNALRQAAQMAAGLNARLQIVAPQIVPWAADLDHPPVDPAFTGAKMLKLAEQAGVDADVHVVLCRDCLVGLESVLGKNAVVVAGENKLTHQLTKRGHHAFVADSFSEGER